jgi:hypothetical protein
MGVVADGTAVLEKQKLLLTEWGGGVALKP